MTSRRPFWCPKTMKPRPCWCFKPVLWELNSFLIQTLSFVPIHLYRYWPREWKHSIRNRLPLMRNPTFCNFESVRQAITFLTSDFADVASTIPSAKRREVKAENQEKCLLIQFKQYFVDLFFVTRQSFVDELLINLCLDYMVTTSSAAKTSL